MGEVGDGDGHRDVLEHLGKPVHGRVGQIADRAVATVDHVEHLHCGQQAVGRNCHNGPLLTDFEFHNTRLPENEHGEERDPGRYRGVDTLLASEFLATGPYSDDAGGEAALKIELIRPKGHDYGEFKTPSLRNVATSAPYMHAGQFETLEDVVRFYDTREGETPAPHPDPLLRPLGLTEEERADLVAFLVSLTNPKLPPELLAPPDSPLQGE